MVKRMAQSDGVPDVSVGRGDGTKEDNVTESVQTLVEIKKRALDNVGVLFYASLIVWLLAIILKMIGGQTNLWPVMAGFFVFGAFNKGLTLLIANPGFLPGLKTTDVNGFLNIAVSLLHSSIVSTSVIVLLVREAVASNWSTTMWTHKVLTGHPWPGAFFVLGISCGYFAYDQWDMLRKRLYRPQSPSLLVHHVVLLVCFTAALFKNSCINYLVLTLICEVHSILLHYRKVSIFVGASRIWTSSLAVEWALNWLTYFVTRAIIHVLITLKLLVDFDKFGAGVELPLALMGMTGLNILNFILGQGLHKAYLKECLGKLHKAS